MQNMSGSYRNLAALAAGDDDEVGGLAAGGPLSFADNRSRASRISVESSKQSRYFSLGIVDGNRPAAQSTADEALILQSLAFSMRHSSIEVQGMPCLSIIST